LVYKFKEPFIETVDIHGNSFRYFSNILLEKKRRDKRGISNVAYLKFITQQPKYLSEAFLMDETSPFDVATIKSALGDLMSKYDEFPIETGTFYLNSEGDVSWKLNLKAQVIDEFPWKNPDTTGNWIIYEKPQTINGTIPYGRYIAGVDPIDWGSGEVSDNQKHSFAATYIIDSITRNIVAEYVSRPETSEMYYEQCWRGVEYFKADLLYENNLKGLFSYFKNKNKSHLLAEEPISLGDKWGYKMSKNPKKGFHATAAINKFARDSINLWSLEDVITGQNEDGSNVTIPRMFFIKSKALLQEMERWNAKGNFDRVSGLGAVMLLLYDRNIEEGDFKIENTKITESKLFKKLRNKMVTNHKGKFTKIK